jgi:hypothetical protein
MHIDNFETLIYGEDGTSPIRNLLLRMLEQAKKDQVRLRIDVRSQAMGTANTRNEHTIFADPNEVDADALMRNILDRLNDSPGEGFLGQLRINFAPAGNSSDRYASWTRTLKSTPMPRMMGGMYSSAQEDENDGSEDDDDDGNSAESFSRPSSRGGGGMMMQQQPVYQGGIVDEAAARAWLDAAMGYCFRSMAQQFSMFERATRMMETYTMRFGFPTAPGIVESRGGEPHSSAPGTPGLQGLGMLPMVLNAAMQLAGNGDRDPAPAPVATTSMQGSPSRVDSRSAAMAGASRMVRALKPLPSRKPLALPARGYEPPPEQEEVDEDYSGDESEGERSGYGMSGYDDEEHASGGDDGSNDEDEGYDEGSDGQPDLNGLSADEMKAAVIAWIRADPSRKADVMGMLPDLSKEIT